MCAAPTTVVSISPSSHTAGHLTLVVPLKGLGLRRTEMSLLLSRPAKQWHRRGPDLVGYIICNVRYFLIAFVAWTRSRRKCLAWPAQVHPFRFSFFSFVYV